MKPNLSSEYVGSEGRTSDAFKIATHLKRKESFDEIGIDVENMILVLKYGSNTTALHLNVVKNLDDE